MSIDSCCLPEDLVEDEVVSIPKRYAISKPYSYDVIFFHPKFLGVNTDGSIGDDISGVLVRVRDKTYGDLRFFYLSSSYDTDDELQLGFSLTPYNFCPQNTTKLFEDNEFLGFVNGILVYREDDSFNDGFYMLNPETGSYKKTAKCITPDPRPKSRASSHFMILHDDEHIGCGFSAPSKDLMVVSFRSYIYCSCPGIPEFSVANDTLLDTEDDNWDESKDFSDARDFFDSHSDSEANDNNLKQINPVRDVNLQPNHLVEVYSLSTDSWRRVEVDGQLLLQFPAHHSYFYPQKGNLSDTFSWLVFDDYDAGNVKLLTFNMTTEVFLVTSLPDAISASLSEPQFPIQLSNGTIALVIHNGAQSSFDIWLLLEYGVMDSWNRLCTIGPFPEVIKFLGFWKDGKVFLESTSGEMVLADLTTNKILQNLPIEGFPGYSQIIPHTEIPFLSKGNCFETQSS